MLGFMFVFDTCYYIKLNNLFFKSINFFNPCLNRGVDSLYIACTVYIKASALVGSLFVHSDRLDP